MLHGKSVTEVVKDRFSCRTYLDRPIEEEKRRLLEDFLASSQTGPFGARTRFELVAATERDRNALRGLGTYGFIKGATGFIVGAVDHSEKNLEDYGYLMEKIILFATAIDLGTCWLGGTFQKSNFAQKISASDGELMPAVSAVGYVAKKRSRREAFIRRSARADTRRPWERMFFVKDFGTPISNRAAGAYAVPLEMVRLGPSASNRQPWRVIKDGNDWHFYLQRTRGYGDGKLWRMADLQRVDMGIAMSHFELAATEAGLKGAWEVDEPDVERPDELTEYIASWQARDG